MVLYPELNETILDIICIQWAKEKNELSYDNIASLEWFQTALRHKNIREHLKYLVRLLKKVLLIAAQDRGPFWFSYILNEILQHIEIWNEFKGWIHCPNFLEDDTTKCSHHFEKR